MNIREEINARLLELAPNLEFQGVVPEFSSSIRVYLMESAEHIFDIRDLQDDSKMKEILNNIIREVKLKAGQLEEIS